MAQVSAREYRDFADAALWTQAKVLQVRDDACFGAWYYRETSESYNPPALPDGPFAQIGELGREFHFAT